MNKKNRIYCGIVVILLLGLSALGYFFYNANEVEEIQETEQEQKFLSFSSFSGDFYLEKKGQIQDYPQIDIISEVDGVVSNINVNIGDEVKKGKNLIQLTNSSTNYVNNMEDAELDIESLEIDYELLQNAYNEEYSEYQNKISDLEEKIGQIESELIKSMEDGDENRQNQLEQEIQSYENQISNLQVELKSKEQEYNSKKISIENEIQSVRAIYDQNYNKMNKLTPRSTINGIVGDVLVKKGDKAFEGDVLAKIKNTENLPEITVNLNFDEYVLVKELESVDVVFQSNSIQDEYGLQESYIVKGIIYSSTSELDDSGNISISIQLQEDEILNSDFFGDDFDYDVLIKFPIELQGYRLSKICVDLVDGNTVFVSIREGENIIDEHLKVKSNLSDWFLIDYQDIESLEKEGKINDISSIEFLCEKQ